MKKQKQNRGITLIALIITVIVILILAGVSISVITGQDSIFTKTQTSVDKYNKAEATEQMNLKVSEVQMKYYSEEHRKATLQEMANYLTADEYVEYVKGGKEIASIDFTKYSSILVKLKAYVYEFEIGENMQVAVLEEGSGGGSGTPITSAISDTNIGDYINLGTNLTDLATTGHKADWRIFDVDSTGVYAILSDYLPNNLTGMPSEIIVNANGWTIGFDVTTKAEAVSVLKTPSNWNFLVPPTSPLRGHITGGPTYEQFAKSWNKLNSSVVNMSETTINSYEPLCTLTKDVALYIPLQGGRSESIYGYKLATENTNTVEGLFDVERGVGDSGTVIYVCNSINIKVTMGDALRPLVHLTSDINVNGQDANGVWQLAE